MPRLKGEVELMDDTSPYPVVASIEACAKMLSVLNEASVRISLHPQKFSRRDLGRKLGVSGGVSQRPMQQACYCSLPLA